MTLPLLLKPFSSLSDDELMQRVSSKDDDRAFSELYRRHARRLMGFFFRQLNGNETLSADLTQDAFMRVWTARDKFSGTHFRTWMFTISYNLLKNHYRHDEHQKEYELLSKQTKEEVADNHIVEQIDNDAFDQALRQELEKLSAESRLLFSFRFEEELTVPEIAALMGLAEGTVKSRLYTLTQTLKQKLNRHEYI